MTQLVVVYQYESLHCASHKSGEAQGKEEGIEGKGQGRC